MADFVTIPIRHIVNVEGRRQSVPKLDEDGEVVYMTDAAPCPVCGHAEPTTGPDGQPLPEMVPMTVLDLIRAVCYALRPPINKPDDSQMVFGAMSRVAQARGKKTLRLPEHINKWLQRAMARRVPLTKEDQELNKTIEEHNKTAKDGDKMDLLEPRPLAVHLWGVNAWAIVEQMKPEGLAFPKEEAEEEEEAGAPAL